MGLIEFFIVVVACCLFAWGACWLLSKLEGVPAFVPFIIWAVAVLIIIVTLAHALGLYGVNPQIPKLR